MKRRIAVVAASVLFATSSLAFAAGMASTGTIKSVSPKSHMLMLDNGQSYSVAKSVDLSKFKTGQKVDIQYTVKNQKQTVTSLMPSS
ncbi:Cu/Ag efflux protein CusF [Rhodoligotrophos appendicifer]|uniref:DUF1344 domain-containing protein n=1 Tax=Rhodoligotrophos appendicifer TaxID=987056 RepID=UPI00117F3AC6|nr:DUF1344 domain-containing protein [Rhodoligotrophos appendicifer]